MELLLVPFVDASGMFVGKTTRQQQDKKVQPERLQTTPHRGGFIPKLFGITISYGYKASTGTKCFRSNQSGLHVRKYKRLAASKSFTNPKC